MSIQSAKWSKFFYRLSIRLVRDVGYPCFGIFFARYLTDAGATLRDCFDNALLLFAFVISIACVTFILSLILSEK